MIFYFFLLMIESKICIKIISLSYVITQKKMRDGVVNEAYYARNNHPNFYQFPSKYDFFDEEGRIYVIARKNKQIFQNARFDTPNTQKTKNNPVANNYGYIKLFVKLPSPDVDWFTRNNINKSISLTHKATMRRIDVVLKIDEKSNSHLRTGAIWVANLVL